MRIAIIGSASMSAAYYRSDKHDVVIFEKGNTAGGNVKPLNGNVKSHLLPLDLHLDSGVIEFHVDHSPALRRLMKELEIPLPQFLGGSNSYYRDNNTVVIMPEVIQEISGLKIRFGKYLSLVWTLKNIIPILFRLKRNGLNGVCGDILGQDALSNWIRMLLMYGYSIPFPQIDNFPVQLAYQTIRQGSLGIQCMRVEGGVYSYMQAILKQRCDSLELRTSQQIEKIECNGHKYHDIYSGQG
jgi:hypothetical protein